MEFYPIYKEVETVSADWTAKNYFGSGEAAGDFLTLLLTRDPTPTSAIPQFLSGFLTEFVAVDNLVNVQHCYKGGEQIET